MKLTHIFTILYLILAQAAFGGGDKLAGLRSEKKIVTVNEISAPYYTIQIVALRLPPGEPGFFKNVEFAKEYICQDGFVRYTVEEFTSFKLAAQQLERIKALGYADAFVLDLRKIQLSGDAHTAPVSAIRGGNFVPDVNADYTIQLAALRFPVYLSHFEKFEGVQEYYMKDKIYRYCVGAYKGSSALEELGKVKAMGYPDAFLIVLDDYLPFKIE
jgi:hypothetical protein